MPEGRGVGGKEGMVLVAFGAGEDWKRQHRWAGFCQAPYGKSADLCALEERDRKHR